MLTCITNLIFHYPLIYILLSHELFHAENKDEALVIKMKWNIWMNRLPSVQLA